MKKHVFTIIALLISTIALGQVVPLSGSGTVENPYIIKNYVEWNSFAESVNGENGFTAYNYEGKYIKLAEDIGSPTELCNIKMVGWFEFAGTWVGHAFAGNFDGNGKTLYVNIQDVEDNIYYAGPFGWVDGAKISNLTVAGQITTTIKGIHAAGIVSCVENNSLRPTYITGCKSKVTIVSRTESERGHHGGLVGWLYEGDLFFENCIFEGSMTGYTANCAGFVGEIRDDKLANVSVSYKNCTQAFNRIEGNPSTFNTYHYPVSDDFPSTFENAYYTYRLASDNQGDRLAEASAPTNSISRKYTSHGATYYVPAAEIEGLRNYIKVYGGLKPYITYYGQELTQDTDYRISISGNTVTLTGQNDYAGTFTATNVEIRNDAITDWATMKTKMAEGTVSFVLQYDIVGPGDDALSVISNKYAFVDLNGHTINRNMSEYAENGYVITANRNATLTIVDRGATKGRISGGKQKGDAGGVYNNWGTLKMYGVNVNGNMAKRKSDSGPYGVGAGVYSNGSMTIIGGVISNNTADGGGGGIYAGGGDATNTLIKGVVIKNNISGSKGGGIRVGERANKVTVEDCYITGNKLEGVNTQDGGGIYNEGSKGLTIKDCTITNNDAMHRGGAFFTLKDGVTHFKNCLITNNTAVQDGGGGIYIHQGEVYIDGCIITGNISNKVGGVYVTTATGKDAKAGGVLYLQGKTTITDNLGDATMPNVYMEKANDLINISDKLHPESRIGVSRVNKGVLTRGLGGNGNIDNFISDNYQYYWLVKDGDEIALKETLRWSKPEEWGGSIDYSKEKKHLTVQAPFIIDKYVLNSVEQIPDVKLLELSSPGKIFIEEKDRTYGQLIYTGEDPVPVTVIKIIMKTNNNAGWYTISAPVENPVLETQTNLITSKEAPYNFDLLRYDEKECMWRSYNDPLSQSTYYPDDKLLNGVGYLYRNYTKLAIEYNGNLVAGSVDVPITISEYEAGISTLPGWNLIGNPYTHNIYKGDNTAITNKSETSDYKLAAGFYTLSNTGAWTAGTDNTTVIMPGQSVLVKAEKAGILTITNTNRKRAASKERNNNEYIEFTVANSNYEDVAYALFDDEEGLPKINHRNPDIPMIYINQDDENYAIATMGDETKAFSLNFKAKTTGQYTLSYKTEGEFNYLHVIDCFTGHDIDMLADEKYSFIASPRDKESRFIVRLQYKPNYSSDDNDIFAYQNGNDVLVSGEGELQVYDAMGRLVMSKRINGAEIVDLNTTGVYILKLIGEETHTQKIVVR